MNRSAIARFNAAAATYAPCATVQQRVAERLAGQIQALQWPVAIRSILEVGCGTGLLTARLRDAFPEASRLAVDASEAMVREARRQMADDGGTAFAVADARCLVCHDRFDLVASSSVLQWIPPLPDTIRNLAGLLRVPGLLATAVMLDGTLGELHAARLCVAADRPPSARLPALDELRQACAAAGLRLQVLVQETLTKEHPSARDFLREIHSQGLTGGPVSAGVRPLTRTQLAALCRVYEERFPGSNGGVRATYCVGYALGLKEAQR